jgi:hypothetical protein
MSRVPASLAFYLYATLSFCLLDCSNACGSVPHAEKYIIIYYIVDKAAFADLVILKIDVNKQDPANEVLRSHKHHVSVFDNTTA